jgi:ribosomal protein S8
MSRIIKSSNSLLSSFIAQLNIGSSRRLRYITVNYSKIIMNIIKLLYKEGVIRLYILTNTKILIYFKYFKGCNLFKFKIISKPSKRIYWSLSNLSLNHNKENFSGFFIISTPIGILTSNECLLYKHISGEILFKIYI